MRYLLPDHLDDFPGHLPTLLEAIPYFLLNASANAMKQRIDKSENAAQRRHNKFELDYLNYSSSQQLSTEFQCRTVPRRVNQSAAEHFNESNQDRYFGSCTAFSC